MLEVYEVIEDTAAVAVMESRQPNGERGLLWDLRDGIGNAGEQVRLTAVSRPNGCGARLAS